MREWHVENQIGKENHFEYRSIQKIGSAKSYILNTEEYRQESTVLHIEDVTLLSVPKRVGVQGEGLRAYGTLRWPSPCVFLHYNATRVAICNKAINNSIYPLLSPIYRNTIKLM